MDGLLETCWLTDAGYRCRLQMSSKYLSVMATMRLIVQYQRTITRQLAAPPIYNVTETALKENLNCFSEWYLSSQWHDNWKWWRSLTLSEIVAKTSDLWKIQIGFFFFFREFNVLSRQGNYVNWSIVLNYEIWNNNGVRLNHVSLLS